MATDAVAEIKARIDIVDVIGGYLALRKSGREHSGLCPFHGEKTASFMVSQEKQVWHCHGCGEGGDVFSFVMRIEHCDFRGALEALAERAGIELEVSGPGAAQPGAARRRRSSMELLARSQSFFEHVLWSTEAGADGRALLQHRHVSEETVRQFGVGFAPAGGPGEDALVRYLTRKAGASLDDIVEAGLAHPARGGHARDRFRHRLVFPIRDERGHTIAFGGRALGDAVPKYLNSPETSVYSKSRAIFGLDIARAAIAETKTALVVEGYFDVVACHAAGVGQAVASSGTALTKDQVRLLNRYADVIILCFDTDSAGRAAASRAVDTIAAEGRACRICLLPGGAKDPDDLARSDPALLVQAVAEARPEWQVLLDVALGEGEGGSVEARRAAADRCLSLLIRIPEAAVRDLYLQEAARRLDLTDRALRADVARAMKEPRRREAPLVVDGAAPSHGPDEAASEPAAPVPREEGFIGSLAVQRPQLAGVLVERHGLRIDDLTHPQIRSLVQLALDSGRDRPFPVHRLGPTEQRVAAELLMEPVPVLDEASAEKDLERAMADSIEHLRDAARGRRMEVVRREMRLAKLQGRDGDVQRFAAELTEMASAADRNRRRHVR